MNWKTGDVFRLNHKAHRILGGRIMIIDEVKNWGVTCHTKGCEIGTAHYRCAFDDMRKIEPKEEVKIKPFNEFVYLPGYDNGGDPIMGWGGLEWESKYNVALRKVYKAIKELKRLNGVINE